MKAFSTSAFSLSCFLHRNMETACKKTGKILSDRFDRSGGLSYINVDNVSPPFQVDLIGKSNFPKM